MLATCTYVGIDKWSLFQDLFDGETLSDSWTAASWCDAAPARRNSMRPS
jgi:hypothetical protein